ncbi:immunoglobulin-like domain-containing protein [Huintestinicola sp.]|uniref:immunoglobulin-like domain-containing protein n=1 Tax=Huintestinicola sp. TaxID=2981661 RepID=UPI003D7F17C0
MGKVTVSGVEYEFDEKGRLIPDEWGITLTAKDVTPTGMTLELLWDGTETTGSLEFGAAYTLEQYRNGKWETLPYLRDDIAFIAISYELTENESFALTQNWEELYGVLEVGKYRLCTSVRDFRKPADYDEKLYYAYFTI